MKKFIIALLSAALFSAPVAFAADATNADNSQPTAAQQATDNAAAPADTAKSPAASAKQKKSGCHCNCKHKKKAKKQEPKQETKAATEPSSPEPAAPATSGTAPAQQ